jgi:hypothetical protein
LKKAALTNRPSKYAQTVVPRGVFSYREFIE